MEIMYEIPSLENVEKCIITPEAVSKNEKPQLIYKELAKAE